MDEFNKNNVRKIGIATAAAVFIVAFGFVVTHGGWLSPGSPTTNNISIPLNTGAGVQVKIGGLIVNKAGETTNKGAKIGLIIGDNGDSDLGFVGIGTAPSKKLDVAGNINTWGVIKPKGRTGKVDQIFTRTKTGNDWKDRYSWMTLTGMPSLCSNPVGPQNCASIGYKEYGKYCIKDPSNNYSVTVRVCYKENF